MRKQPDYVLAGKLSEPNKWLADVCAYLQRECEKHGRGYLFVPFRQTEDIIKTKWEDERNPEMKTLLATNLDNFAFQTAIMSALENYYDVLTNAGVKGVPKPKNMAKTIYLALKDREKDYVK